MCTYISQQKKQKQLLCMYSYYWVVLSLKIVRSYDGGSSNATSAIIFPSTGLILNPWENAVATVMLGWSGCLSMMGLLSG